ncbi:hypothetical protein GCM10010267_51310 [Streptomyces griseorubens]|nr:hypothetical protein GCM10010267_51310 [Streptomyces griseorubens]
MARPSGHRAAGASGVRPGREGKRQVPDPAADLPNGTGAAVAGGGAGHGWVTGGRSGTGPGAAGPTVPGTTKRPGSLLVSRAA